jgi:hypothetical protein
VAISVVQFQKLSTGGSLTNPVTSGNSVLVGAFCYTTSGSNITTSSPTLNGSTPTGSVLLKSEISPAGSNRVYGGLWLLPNTSGGNGFNITCSDNVLDLFVMEVSTGGATLTLDQSAVGSGTSSTAAAGPTGTTATASELVVALAGSFGVSFGGTLGSPWTTIGGSTGYDECSYQLATATGTFTWSNGLNSSAAWSALVTTLYASSGGTSHTATASLTVTPAFTAHGTHTHGRTAHLTVTPSFTAHATRGHSRTATLAVTPAFTAHAARGRYRSAQLTVTPSFTAHASHVHARSASLTVTPGFTAHAARGHSRTAHLIVTPAFTAVASVGGAAHTRTAVLVITPTFRAVASHNGGGRVTSRPMVRIGIAEYFGGTTYDAAFRTYRDGPLNSYGLSSVHPYQPKKLPDFDYVLSQNPGRGMGAIGVIEMNETRDTPLTVSQIPSNLNGQRMLVYPIQLHIFHLAHRDYAEDAEADVDALDQALHEHIYADPTLGEICYQAGLSPFGIRTLIDPAETFRKELTAIHFRVCFDVQIAISVGA